MRWLVLLVALCVGCSKKEDKSDPAPALAVAPKATADPPKKTPPKEDAPSLGRSISDNSTHRDLAALLKSKGVVLDVQQENWKSAVFTDPATGGRVAVIKAPSAATAQRAVEEGGKEWVDCYAEGPFFIGAAKHGEDAKLCSRIRAALK